jgi:hypothetical protein
MLGWMISVHRQLEGGSRPATVDALRGRALAMWQTGCDGLVWLDDLVSKGAVEDLGGNGYPLLYTAKTPQLLPFLISGSPPKARASWVYGPQDRITSAWHGRTYMNLPALESCRPNEWLVIEAWDES